MRAASLARALIAGVSLALVSMTPASAQTAGLIALGVNVTEGAVQKDQVFFRAPVAHARVGRLQNDIRGTGIVNSDRIVIPKGTLVYWASFGAGDGRPPRYRGWCGAVTEERSSKRLGYCMFEAKKGNVLGKLRSDDSFYFPTSLADYEPRPITAAQVAEDASLRAELPKMELCYAFDEWEKSWLQLISCATVDGVQYNRGGRSVRREADGSAIFAQSGASVRLTPSADGKSAIVTLTGPPLLVSR